MSNHTTKVVQASIETKFGMVKFMGNFLTKLANSLNANPSNTKIESFVVLDGTAVIEVFKLTMFFSYTNEQFSFYGCSLVSVGRRP